MAEEKFLYLVCYDIREPKRWRRTYKLLKGYGKSLQYSIFECKMTRRELETHALGARKGIIRRGQPDDRRFMRRLPFEGDR